MKTNILRICTAVSSIATAAAGAAAYANILPAKYAAMAGIVTASILALKEVAAVVGDVADDGQLNKSFRP